jgi:NAD dependent epimerase/dehydratase
MNWQATRVLVTGAGGFVGSHLTERLMENGASVRALVRYKSDGGWGWLDHSPLKNEIEVVRGDVVDHEFVRQTVAGCEVVFHLAALIAIPYSYQAPQSYVRTNVEGTLNVLQAARAADVRRIVHTSTSEVYGTAQYVPIDEGHPLVGQSPYAATKIGADKLAESFHRSFGLPVVTLRPFNTFGPRQSTRAVIPTIITQALASRVIKLGSLTPTRDMNYVADTVDAFVKAAVSDAAVGQVVNVGSGREIAIGDLARLICELAGVEPRIECDEQRLRPKDSEVERLLADNTRSRDLLGWQPQVSLEDGLRRTIAWIRENFGRYEVGQYAV